MYSVGTVDHELSTSFKLLSSQFCHSLHSEPTITMSCLFSVLSSSFSYLLMLSDDQVLPQDSQWDNDKPNHPDDTEDYSESSSDHSVTSEGGDQDSVSNEDDQAAVSDEPETPHSKKERNSSLNLVFQPFRKQRFSAGRRTMSPTQTLTQVKDLGYGDSCPDLGYGDDVADLASSASPSRTQSLGYYHSEHTTHFKQRGISRRCSVTKYSLQASAKAQAELGLLDNEECDDDYSDSYYDDDSSTDYSDSDNELSNVQMPVAA